VFLVLFVSTNVLSPISPRELALAVHLSVLPVSSVLTFVRQYVGAETRDLVVHPIALILGPISPLVYAIAVFASLFESASVFGSVIPGLRSLPFLHVVEPVPLVARTVDVSVHAVAIGFVFSKFALVDVALCVPILTTALGLVSLPVALVPCAILPDLDAVPLPDKFTILFPKHLPMIHRIL
jgi:hypothetical protein